MRGGGSRNELVSSKHARMNGWSWPPQVAQVIGWVVFVYLAIVSFGIYIPLLPLPWNHVVYAVSLTPCERLLLWMNVKTEMGLSDLITEQNPRLSHLCWELLRKTRNLLSGGVFLYGL